MIKGNAKKQLKETKKEKVVILTEEKLMQLNDLFDKFIPPAYSRPIVALLNSCEKKEM